MPPRKRRTTTPTGRAVTYAAAKPVQTKPASSDDMLDEALVEHVGAKKLIAEIEAMKPQDDLRAWRVYQAAATCSGEAAGVSLPA